MIRAIRAILYCSFPIIGTLCIVFPDGVTAALPYLLGGAMVLTAVVRGIRDIRNREVLSCSSYALAQGLVLLIMGMAFIVQGPKSLGPMGTTWAIIGIRKASKSLGQAIRRIHAKEHFFVPMMGFLLRITLALILLFNPFEKFSTHVAILGLELIVTSVRFSRDFLSVWDDEN